MPPTASHQEPQQEREVEHPAPCETPKALDHFSHHDAEHLLPPKKKSSQQKQGMREKSSKSVS
jgi:hypothetical protein